MSKMRDDLKVIEKITQKRKKIQDYHIVGDDYVAIKEEGLWEIVNKDGDTITGEKYYALKMSFDRYAVKYQELWYLLNKDFDREETEYKTFADLKRAMFQKKAGW